MAIVGSKQLSWLQIADTLQDIINEHRAILEPEWRVLAECSDGEYRLMLSRSPWLIYAAVEVLILVQTTSYSIKIDGKESGLNALNDRLKGKPVEFKLMNGVVVEIVQIIFDLSRNRPFEPSVPQTA